MTRTTNPAAHLSPAAMATAQRHLVAKAIAEFTHERLLAPERLAGRVGAPAPYRDPGSAASAGNCATAGTPNCWNAMRRSSG